MKEYTECPLYQNEDPACCGIQHDQLCAKWDQMPQKMFTLSYKDGLTKTIPLWVVNGNFRGELAGSQLWVSFLEESSEAILAQQENYKKDKLTPQSEQVLRENHPSRISTLIPKTCLLYDQ